MPLYLWLDKKSGKKVEVLRNFDNYKEHPTEEESGISPDEAEWQRYISGGQTVIKTGEWGPGKGYWITLFMLGGMECLSYLDMIL